MAGRRDFIETMPSGRVVRHENGYTSVLRWCGAHLEPVWQYGDGSYECPHTLIVGGEAPNHKIGDAPWERPQPSTGER